MICCKYFDDAPPVGTSLITKRKYVIVAVHARAEGSKWAVTDDGSRSKREKALKDIEKMNAERAKLKHNSILYALAEWKETPEGMELVLMEQPFIEKEQ